ncbi:MAG: 6-pyruvoyl trahydropterin synthase family protein [Methanomicrobiales archaeon]
MTTRIYKEVFFEASHRLLHYDGKCARLHGHQWRVQVWVDGPVDAETGIVVDFNCIKDVVHRFDHQVILNREDPMVSCLSQFQEVITTVGDPTSEVLAGVIAELIGEACRTVHPDAWVAKIRVWESVTCYAERDFDHH